MKKFSIFGAALCLIGAPAIAGQVNPPGISPFGDTSNTTALSTGGSTSRKTANRFSDTINVMDYGAKCDNSTNDNTAINAAITAAANSTAYSNNNAVNIVGPVGNGGTQGCIINSLNFTQFTRGNGSNTRARVRFSDISLLCTGAGNICIDATKSSFVEFYRLSLRGDSTPGQVPEIGIQFSLQSNAASSAWNSTDHVSVNNEFTFAAIYNFASESYRDNTSMFVNNHTSSGTIASLGSVTGGTSYTNGTYTSVPLTGGSGAGALATVVVSGGAVTTVTISYEGKDYVTGDTLSAAAANIGGTGSGFSVPVASTTSYAMVWDGQDHWRSTSTFSPLSGITPDTWGSLTLVELLNSHARTSNTTAPVWMGWAAGLKWIGGYILNQNGPYCVDLFDNNVTKGGIPGPNWGLDLQFNCEGNTTAAFFLNGSHANPTIQNFSYRGYHQSSGSTFVTDTNITAPTINGGNVNVDFVSVSPFNAAVGIPTFSNAKIWSYAGRFQAPGAPYWNAPASFAGSLALGSLTNPIGPADIFSGAVAAYSCARLVNHSYTGPLCQVERSSDSTTMDLYPNANGDLDKTGFQSFCNGTTCSWSVLYDQIGANNFTQGTTASQPVMSLSVAALGNRPAALWADQGAQAMTATAASAINDIFASGGYITTVVDQTGNANQADRILYKSNAGTIGWEWRCGFVGTSNIFVQTATTTAGNWQTGSLNAIARVQDIQYSSAALSNNPTIGSNGTAQTLTTTNPVGTINSDASQNLLLGNNAATGGNRGFPGYIAEVVIWKSTPAATQLEAIRRNQAAYYGISGVN